MNLADVLECVVYKRLVVVDLPEHGSNQHEINGVLALRQFFGTKERTHGSVTWHYLADGEDPVTETGEFTFYDARERDPRRTEWRLYYSGEFISKAVPGDVLVIIKPKHDDRCIHGLVLQQGSTWLLWVQKLFEASNLNPENFDLISQEELSDREIGVVTTTILDLLDLEDLPVGVPASDIELVTARFGLNFPSTKAMSAFAREHSIEPDLRQPDVALVTWLEREEQLFRALERVTVEKRLASGFIGVDDFVAYSLTVHNRRKSRMGFSLQNHLAAIFDASEIRYEAQATTEGRNRPDFVFPGGREYRDLDFDAALLVMLGAKSTLKERWRQILPEAGRIPHKHLCTLQPGISQAQTQQISEANVQLVIPSPIHETYSREQRTSLWTVSEFVDFVRTKQAPNRG